jgi:phage gpG-like protein
MQNFINKINRIQRFIQSDVQDVVGTEAVNHFKESFQNEGFSNVSEKDMSWKEVKRRQKGGGKAASRRKILTGESGELGDSISYSKQNRDVLIKNDKIYAEVHNKGLRAGRGKGFIMPKRQFIGKSALLNKKIANKISIKMRNL